MKRERHSIVQRREATIFEIGSAGRRGYKLPALDVPEADLSIIPESMRRGTVKGMPAASEVDVVRHFTRLSRLNYAVDLGLYPLGSCTMKYNPKINEELARLDGFAGAHPFQEAETVQGCLRVIWELERCLREITGMHRFTLQPAAGAQGELSGILMIRAHLEKSGNPRHVMLVPDSAHGTNPASAALAGYRTQQVPTNSKGCIDLAALRERMTTDVAGLMLTNPNTLGIFEEEIEEICAAVHGKGGLVYCDGANMNALVGTARPGDMGVDVLHLNLHKTFSTPHGGGGPGSGPVGVSKTLAPYLPSPLVVEHDGRLLLDRDRPDSIGRLTTFQGNFGMHVRALAYIRSLGPDGLREVSRRAVLNANYVRARLKETFPPAYETPSLHEVILTEGSLERHGVKTLDLAKRLLDYGFHPPTIYFPLIVRGAIMIEPTETESRAELDAFVAAMLSIAEEAAEDPELVRGAPH
ncbi:MAG TPA: aminomethyl-transferring glycine dehydrogenase subunit GcvPB, partial [Candidatus Saccharimonadales bacterium]|nr:aminomethyl-transferring glycine dehydrogenase subunit GcvPB [Candidatus Saccharimonadales bacterium]